MSVALASQDGRSFRDIDFKAEATYAQASAGQCMEALALLEKPVEQATLLEIGPGNNLAHLLAVAGLGVRVIVADRFPTQWVEDFHRPLYEAFLEVWPGPAPLVERALSGNQHGALVSYNEPAEALASVPDESIDVVYSCAVLEHVTDFVQTSAELHRVSRPGGVQRHQIDYRDHRDFSRPLEFFVEEWPTENHWQFGNRVRPWEACKMFEAAGFEVLANEPNCFAEPEYLADFISRYPAATEDFRVLGSRFTIRKPPLPPEPPPPRPPLLRRLREALR